MHLRVRNWSYKAAFGAAMTLILSAPVMAQEVNITPGVRSVEFTINGTAYKIERIQDTENKLDNSFAKTSRPCPEFCIHAMSAAPGVVTTGELELLDFLQQDVANGRGVLIDARIPSWFEKGTIPGAINIPFTLLSADDNPYMDKILTILGATKAGAQWDFANARKLMLFCNGPWCDQSPRAIKGLIAAGYPADKLLYYRGGMQNWQMLGLTVAAPAAK